jgi:predicted nucleotidyltransferase component of viral defense system
MNLFDRLVNQALESGAGLEPLRIVVEKELLHHDILREMSQSGFLEKLCFIGGTCLRACYGSHRLSEDLDFTGGFGFKRDDFKGLAATLMQGLESKYGLLVTVAEPVKESGNVETWKLKMITRPETRMVPAQRINIDIALLPSYDCRPMMLRNTYGVEMGTSSLILRAESREEIFADKIIALAMRPNRIKNRDLWDIVWLDQQGVGLPYELVARKIADRKITDEIFTNSLSRRLKELDSDPRVRKNFIVEMERFLPRNIVDASVKNSSFWQYLVNTVSQKARQTLAVI